MGFGVTFQKWGRKTVPSSPEFPWLECCPSPRGAAPSGCGAARRPAGRPTRSSCTISGVVRGGQGGVQGRRPRRRTCPRPGCVRSCPVPPRPPPVMYSQQWSPVPSTTAQAPELRTAKRSPARPAANSAPPMAPYSVVFAQGSRSRGGRGRCLPAGAGRSRRRTSPCPRSRSPPRPGPAACRGCTTRRRTAPPSPERPARWWMSWGRPGSP